ncbi:transposase [Embleya sp. NPDC020886]|uniref:transposase n=2 Tax=Embleya TaxID=2699295 RepID=UPI0037ADA178
MGVRDRLGVFRDEGFAAWYSSNGRPVPPACLVSVSALQFEENPTDCQSAKAVRRRIDRTYAPGLELDDPGFDDCVLSEFRDRIVRGSGRSTAIGRIGAEMPTAHPPGIPALPGERLTAPVVAYPTSGVRAGLLVPATIDTELGSIHVVHKELD